MRSVLAKGGLYISTIPGLKTYAPVLGNVFRTVKAAVVVVRSRRADLDILRQLIERKRLRPIVDSVHERSDVIDAYKHLETKRARGKVIVRMT